jgi:transcription elongation factor GreB
VFFGATVDLINTEGEEQTVRIVGVDEIDTQRGWISWISPVARALLKAQEGDEVRVIAPGGVQVLEVTGIRYESLDL